jgi:uncharacterized integral membrane protein (TIGR00697 family)
MQIVSDVSAGKIIQVVGMPVSITVLYFPITFIFADVLTEVYGYAYARRVLWTVMLCAFLAGIMYQVVVYVPPSPDFANNDAYVTVFGAVPRIVLGSYVAVFTGEILNDYVLAKMKIWTDGKHLWTRLVGSTVAGQLVNTALFYTVALYGVLPDSLLFKSILSGWLLKVLVEIAVIPVTYWVVAKLKHIEQVDFFDRDTNFNPFVIR